MYLFLETPSLWVLEFGKMNHHPRDDPLETEGLTTKQNHEQKPSTVGLTTKQR